MNHLSAEGLAKIAGFETFVWHIYPDFAGVRTIGYGHVMRGDERYTTLTEAEAMDLLRLDARTAEDAVNRLVRVPLTQSQFDALVSFTFNEGGGHLASSTLLRLLNQSDYQGAADQFLAWDKYRDHGQLATSPTLDSRRQAEREMFLREPPAQPPRDYSENVQHAAIIDRERPSR